MTIEDVMAMTERLARDEPENSSMVLNISAEGKKVTQFRGAGPEEYSALAITPAGEIWLGRSTGELEIVNSEGKLLWQLSRLHD